jgi:hypothetical protein
LFSLIRPESRLLCNHWEWKGKGKGNESFCLDLLTWQELTFSHPSIGDADILCVPFSFHRPLHRYLKYSTSRNVFESCTSYTEIDYAHASAGLCVSVCE